MSADTKSVDVLAVLDAYASGASGARFVCGVDEREHVARIHRDAIAARAAIAELIEADKAYDAALAAEASADADGDDDLICNAVRKLQWATDRRKAALARVQGGSK